MTEPKNTLQDIESMRENSPSKTGEQSPRYASGDLFAKASEIRIDHNGATYTLRITRSGGLLLNK